MICSMCTGGGIALLGLVRRIDHLHDGFIGEPEPSVGRARGSRLKWRERGPDTVQRVEHFHVDDRVAALPPFPQFRIRDAHEAALRVEPQRTLQIEDERMNAAAGKTVLRWSAFGACRCAIR